MSELDSLDDLLDSGLEEVNLPRLDSLVIIDEMVVLTAFVAARNHTTLKKPFAVSWAGSNKLTGDLSSISSVDNNSLEVLLVRVH